MFFVLLDLILCKTKYSKPPIELGNPTHSTETTSNFYDLSKTNEVNNARNWLIARGFSYADADAAIKKIKLSKKANIDKHKFSMDLLNNNRRYERTSTMETLYVQSTKTSDGTYFLKCYKVKTNMNVISKLVITKKKKFLGITIKKKVVNEWRPLIASELERVFNKIEPENTRKVNSLIN